MKTFDLNQIQQAQDYRPQIERFITDKIYVIEYIIDYESLPASVKEIRQLLASQG